MAFIRDHWNAGCHQSNQINWLWNAGTVDLDISDSTDIQMQLQPTLIWPLQPKLNIGETRRWKKKCVTPVTDTSSSAATTNSDRCRSHSSLVQMGFPCQHWVRSKPYMYELGSLEVVKNSRQRSWFMHTNRMYNGSNLYTIFPFKSGLSEKSSGPNMVSSDGTSSGTFHNVYKIDLLHHC